MSATTAHYTCPISGKCKQKFFSKGTLSNHLRSHEKDFATCSVCQRVFKNRDVLVSHYSTSIHKLLAKQQTALRRQGDTEELVNGNIASLNTNTDNNNNINTNNNNNSSNNHNSISSFNDDISGTHSSNRTSDSPRLFPTERQWWRLFVGRTTSNSITNVPVPEIAQCHQVHAVWQLHQRSGQPQKYLWC